MIGIDTKVLLRLWLNDDPAQNKRIDVLLAEHGSMPGSMLVTDVVLVEAVWTLKSAFEQDKQAQSLAVRSLLEETAFDFEDREAVSAALSDPARRATLSSRCGPRTQCRRRPIPDCISALVAHTPVDGSRETRRRT